MKVTDILDYYPLPAYNCMGFKAIVLKHSIFDDYITTEDGSHPGFVRNTLSEDMCDLPDAVARTIKEVLPDLSQEDTEHLHLCLWDLGVRSISELEYVQDSEMASVLNPISRRKLLHLWKNFKDSAQLETPTTSQSASPSLSIEVPAAQQCQSHDWPATFPIPFQRANPNFMNDLIQKKRPKKNHLLEFVRLVCNDIYKVCSRPGRAHLAEIAKRIVAEYPDSLSDTLGGSVVGSGYDSLRVRLENRLDNLNRGSSDGPPKATSPQRVQDAKTSGSYGCIEWSSSLPAGETIESQENKRIQLAEMFPLEAANLNDAEILMDETYFLQREHINEGIPVSEVQEKWPWLLTVQCLHHHFKRLTGIDGRKQFRESMTIKGKAILQFLMTSKKEDVQKIIECVNESFRSTGSHYGEPVAVLLGTIASLHEDPSLLIVELEPDKLVQDAVLPLTPAVVSLGNPYTSRDFMIAADQQIVMSGLPDFTDSLSCLMAVYFVFNIAYPQEAQATLDFFQRCFLKINPLSGSKAKKKRHGPGTVTQKVLSFVESIKRHEATTWVFGQ